MCPVAEITLSEKVAEANDEERLITMGSDDQAKVAITEPAVQLAEPAGPYLHFERSRTNDEVATPARSGTRQRHRKTDEPGGAAPGLVGGKQVPAVGSCRPPLCVSCWR